MPGGRTAPKDDFSARILEHATSNGAVWFQDDELVVRLPYGRLVQDVLDRWSARPGSKEPDDLIAAIGLCRLHLDSAVARSTLARDLPDWYRKAETAAREDGYVDADGRVHDLEIVLRCLRLSFEHDNQGWTPTIGKNRQVQRLHGSYVIDGGGSSPGPSPEPDYVIEGSGPMTGDSRLVALRGRSPSARTRVGLVDTPMWPHPWLSGAVVADPEDFVVGERPATTPPSSHATFVAGLVLRQAPGAVVEFRAGLDEGANSDTWTVARQIADLAESSVELVNLSFGCMTEDAKPPLVLAAAIDALSPRTVVVAAAGNHADEASHAAPPSYPAALDNVIAVGALDGSEAASFSPDAPWVDAMALGVGVASTVGSRSGSPFLGTWSGTSFAAAAVSGAIAAHSQRLGSAGAAWEHLRHHSPVDPHGRPVFALRTLPDWPPDRSGTSRVRVPRH